MIIWIDSLMDNSVTIEVSVFRDLWKRNMLGISSTKNTIHICIKLRYSTDPSKSCNYQDL